MTRVGIGLPQELDGGDAQRLAAYAHRAEEVGFDAVWVQDQVFGRRPRSEPLVTLSSVAAHAPHCQLGAAVAVVPGRHPVELARLAATLQVLSGGRLVLGLAGGSAWTAARLGIDPDQRLPMLREAVHLLRELWSGAPVTVSGEHWSVDRAILRAGNGPINAPRLMIGGGSPAALRFAAHSGDGWIGAGSSTTPAFERQLARLRGELADRRADADEFVVAKRLYFHVGRSDGDRRRVREWFTSYYGDASPAEAAVIGSIDDCAAAARRILELGVDELILSPVIDEEAQLEFAAELLPLIRGPQPID